MQRLSLGAAFLPEMIEIPAGWFTMGSDSGRPDERPVHRVFVSAFAVARLPVTNREFGHFVASGQPPPRYWDDPRFNAPEQPVVGIRWADAVAYCAWLSRKSGRSFRLPTEAEWERAAVGGVDGQLYPWGSYMAVTAAGLALAQQPMDRTAPAGDGPINGFGIGDMGWNVHEWCSDWYDPSYYAESPERDPRGPPTGSRRASRGGAWRHQIKVSRCAARSSIPPGLEYNDYGFRVFARPTYPEGA